MKLQHIEASILEVCVHLRFCILRNGEFLNIFNRTLRSCLTYIKAKENWPIWYTLPFLKILSNMYTSYGTRLLFIF